MQVHELIHRIADLMAAGAIDARTEIVDLRDESSLTSLFTSKDASKTHNVLYMGFDKK